MWVSATQQVNYRSYIFCIHQTDQLQKKWEYHAAEHQLFIDYKKACDSVGRDVLYNILTQSCIPTTPVSLLQCVQNKPSQKCERQIFVRYISYSERYGTRRCFIATAIQPCFRIGVFNSFAPCTPLIVW